MKHIDVNTVSINSTLIACDAIQKLHTVQKICHPQNMQYLK